MLLASTGLILLTLAGYAALCALQPFAVCRKCSGTGLRDTRRRSLKLCRRCHGDRYRLRAGRRLANTSRSLHRDGTRPDPTPGKETLPWQ
ncbi:hypothetical protein AN217_17245 [Streptomyces qinglanensis]|uniref:Uncharacterized protein n=1 Tax=Streptomyces qinglanensis TaxID=943816 RepID=A0A1E7K5Q9_9ACTN|nr:hypothetical protein [Streptomyces qinglanensis]OEU99267.1 hypothetical protein AN217_17245 [Streptomyces qinglanensis]OEV28363.1 hypothetical protein AN220_01905 [Streptomyces nanshensis]